MKTQKLKIDDRIEVIKNMYMYHTGKILERDTELQTIVVALDNYEGRIVVLNFDAVKKIERIK